MDYGFLEPFTEKINMIGALIVTLFSYIFGEHWVLFVAFLILNVGDYVSGCIRSHLVGKTNSKKGLNGILKKMGYWIMIMLAFGMSVIFVEIGNVIGIDLHITELIGWLVLASLIVNEIRSILENLVEAGYNVPGILVKGLEIANKAIDEFDKEIDDE